MSLWLVRAGKYGEDEAIALEKGLAIIGFKLVKDASKTKTRDEIIAALKEALPDAVDSRINNLAGQFYSFVHKIQINDLVVLPLKSKPQIAIGKIKSDYQYSNVNGEMRHTRNVEWIKTDILRTAIKQDLLYSLGAFMTICQIKRNNAEQRFAAILEGKVDPGYTVDDLSDTEEEIVSVTDVGQLAQDQIMNHLQSYFRGHDLERLVDAILQAEGFTTDLVTPGPDGGVDIIAGKGEFGFGNPRICVQVKSSDNPVDVNVYRNLKGVLKNFSADYGILVSWGGFKSSVEKEARGDFFVIRLWDADDILDAIQKNYDKFPEELQKELPLKRMWVLVQGDGE